MSQGYIDGRYSKPSKEDDTPKRDVSDDALSEIQPRSLLNESFSSSNFGNNFRTSTRPELKSLQQERIMNRMSRSEANSPRFDSSGHQFGNFNKIFAHFETDRSKLTIPLLQHSNSSKSIEDLENQWETIKKQHNFEARTSLSPNRNALSFVKTDSCKSASSQSENDRKNLFDVSRRGTTEKPVVSNLLSKVVPQAKINLVQSIDLLTRQSKRSTANSEKLSSKSPRQSTNIKLSNTQKQKENSNIEESDSQLSDSHSRSPTSNMSVDAVSSNFRSFINDQKRKRYTNNQFHAKSKSPTACGNSHEHSPGLEEYRNMIKKALNDNFGSEVKNIEDAVTRSRKLSTDKLRVGINPISKANAGKITILDDLVPEREASNKNEPRQTTPVKKLKSQLYSKNTPDSNNLSPLSATDRTKSYESMKLGFGLPLKRDYNITSTNINSPPENDGSATLVTTLKKNSPNYFIDPISPSRDIFSKGVVSGISPEQNAILNSKVNQNHVLSLSPIRNIESGSLFEQQTSKPLLKTGNLHQIEPELNDAKGEISPNPEKDYKYITKLVVTKLNPAPQATRKPEKTKTNSKNSLENGMSANRRKKIQPEYNLAEKDGQGSLSKELTPANARTFKLPSGQRAQLSRREEREHYDCYLNNISNNEPKADSINASLDKGQILNSSQLAQGYSNLPTATNNISQENFYAVPNSLKSSFKDNPPNKSDINAKPQNKKDNPKVSTPKAQKFYYLPRNDENPKASTKPKDFNAKGTIAKLIKCPMSMISIVIPGLVPRPQDKISNLFRDFFQVGSSEEIEYFQLVPITLDKIEQSGNIAIRFKRSECMLQENRSLQIHLDKSKETIKTLSQECNKVFFQPFDLQVTCNDCGDGILSSLRDVDNQKTLKKAKKIKQLDEDNKKLRQLLKTQLENSEKLRLETQSTVETLREEFELLVKELSNFQRKSNDPQLVGVVRPTNTSAIISHVSKKSNDPAIKGDPDKGILSEHHQ